MSFLAGLSPNFAANQQAATNKNLVEPEQVPGFFEGALDPITSGGAIDTLAANAQILGGLALTQYPKALDQLLDSGTTFTDLWMKKVVEPAVRQRKAAMPDPRTHGMAAQIVQGLATVLPEAALGGPIGAGVIEGTAEAATRVSEGKPVDVALKMGAITGVSTGVGVAIPAAAPVVTTIPLSALKQRVLSGAFGNLLFGTADREARHKVLADAGYQEEAAQYRFDDPTFALVDLVMGAGFGALAHIQARPSETAAALVLNEARKIDNSAPGLPTDAAAATEHYNALRDSLAALENGDEVTARVDQAKFLPDPVKESADAEMLAIAGNRLTRKDRQRLEFERADLEFKLKQFDEQGGYTKQDFIDQARVENPRAPARQVARIAEQMAEDARVNDRADRQSMLERVNKQLEDDALARELFGEIDRINQRSPQNVRTESVTDTADMGAAPAKPAESESTSGNAESVLPAKRAEISPDNRNDSKPLDEPPELAAVRQLLDTHGDETFTLRDENDIETTATLRDLMDEVDHDMKDSNQIDSALQAAVNCFLRFGDNA